MIIDFALAIIPIAWLIVALAGLKLPGHIACVSALLASIILAALHWHLEALNIATAALEGALNALWPICLVVVAALFTYNLTVRTGAMETIKRMLSGISRDKRILALLIAWGFGNFMEGMAGFGTAVAIPASMLVGIGFNPIVAVVGCLVVNATPTAFGSVGVPTATLSTITSIDSLTLSAEIACMEALLTFAAPFFLVAICGGGAKALRGSLAVTFLAAFSFTGPWLITALFIGPELPNIIGAACSMACIIAYSRFSRGEVDTRYALPASGENAIEAEPCASLAVEGRKASVSLAEANLDEQASQSAADRITLGAGLRAWAPFALVFVLLLATSTICPPVHAALAGIKSSVVVYAGENPNTLTFSWVGTPGVMIFIAALIGGAIQGARPSDIAETFVGTFKAYWRTLLTICSVLAMAKVMTYSGMIADIALVLVTTTGPLYPLIAPAIGSLGGFVTGSGTSSNVLFGPLQVQTANDLGLDPSWIAAANATGAGIGKMICPQSIAIGASAANMPGSEPKILGSVFKYFALYIAIACVLCFAGSVLA